MSNLEKFTVIIPTLNRSDTLRSSIKTCIDQDDTNFSIIVSDNASDDNTSAAVAEFNHPRLSYIKSSSRLGMAEHWEFALSHIDSGFVTILGDDDGLLPGAISTARAIIAELGGDVLTWQKIEYCWPEHIIPSYRNWLHIPTTYLTRRRYSEKTVKEVVDFKTPYNHLPCIYNSFISINLINKHKNKNNGMFFGCMSPDIYSSFAIADAVESYIFTTYPLSINGASSKSNGTLNTQGKKESEIVTQFFGDTKFRFEPDIPMGRVIELAVIDGFYKVQKISASFQREWVKNDRVIESAVFSATVGVKSDDAYSDWIGTIRQFAEHVGLAVECERVIAENPRKADAGEILVQGLYPSAIVLDAATIGVCDVYDCSKRSSEIISFKKSKPALFAKLADTKTPLIGLTLLARAGEGPVRLHLGCGYAYFDGYVNVDYPQSEHSVMTVRPDVACNVNQIDLPPDSIDEVRLHHVFEHFNRTVALGSLIQWHRWLRPGGKLHVETPDFEASAMDFMQAYTLEGKMRAIRHLEGDQADAWAYHVGQWFPARFKATFEMFGFEDVEIVREASGHNPPLFNVTAIGYKGATRTTEQQFEAGCQLLRSLMVADAEQPTWEVWRGQLADVLALRQTPQPAINHPATLPMAQATDAKPIDSDQAHPVATDGFRAKLRSNKLMIRKTAITTVAILVAVLASPLILVIAAAGFLLSVAVLLIGIWIACAHLIRRINSWRIGRESTSFVSTAAEEVPLLSAIERKLREMAR